jgi:hypothetical protein
MLELAAFFREWAWACAGLLTFGLVGYSLLIPFRATSPNIVLAAPFAGLLVLILLTMGGATPSWG